jgi:ATP-dependent Clp protease ATP-binding subunit ClpA
MADELKIAFSNELERTLHRSLAIANEREAKFATIEHLLLALTDDSDAASALKACAVDIRAFQSRVIEFLQTQNVEKLAREEDSKPTDQFQRVIQRAVIHVQTHKILSSSLINIGNNLKRSRPFVIEFSIPS